MKNTLLALLLSLLTVTAWAQNVRVVVSDSNTNEPLMGVTASFEGDAIAVTDNRGALSIPCTASELSLSLEGYSTIVLDVSSCQGPYEVSLTKTRAIREVNVYGSRAEQHIDISSSDRVTTLNRDFLQQQTGLFINESMNRISGVKVENRTASGGQRISIRGYGNTERFNGYGYRAYLNGIPITDAEGVTILDEIDPAMMQSISVLKGPNSTRYGNGIAGTVFMETYRPSRKGSYLTQALTVGSNGLFRSNTRFENKSDYGSVVLNYGYQDYEGYRVHSASNREFISINGDVNLRQGEALQYYFAHYRTDEELAGQLDSAQFFNRENVGEARYLANDAAVQFEGFRASLGYVNEWGPWNYRANVFVNQRDQAQSYAVGLNRNSRAGYGGRTTLGWHSEDSKWNLTAGTEVQFNLSRINSYGMTDAVLTSLNSDLELRANNVMAFAEATYYASRKVYITAGVSATSVSYAIDDFMRYDTTHLDGSGQLNFGWQPSPRVLIGYDVSENLTLSGSWSRGFAAPTSSNIVIPEIGEVNSDLKPEVGTQYEFGFNGNSKDKRLTYSGAIYLLSINGKLTSEAITDTAGSVLYSRATNAGAQSNFGIEADVSYDVITGSSGLVEKLTLMANYSYSNHRYVDFYSDANNDANTVDFSGNRVSGVSPHIANFVVSGEVRGGFYFNVGYQYVDKMPINFSNDEYAPAFSLFNAKVGYRYSANRWNLDAYAGGQNLSNSLYYNMVILNQTGRGGNAPKVFLPGSYNATFFAGISVSYQL
ncbi:MAG: TonB-dependent receptor [Flavobacteriia bacterium]|nr:TonB-dependent receptor [Flavobacteriia bacterium]